VKELPPLWNRNFTLMCVSVFLGFLSFYFLLPVLPMYLSSHFNADKTQVGMVLGTFTLAPLLTRPVFAYFLDKGHKRSVLLVSFFLFGLLTLPYIFAPSIAAIFALRILHGATWGGTTISSASIIVDFIPPERRGEGLGVYGVGITLAMAFGPLLGASIVSGNNFPPVFMVATGLGVFAFVVATAIRFPAFRPEGASKFKFSAHTFVERKVLPIAGNMLIMSFCYGGLISFIPLYAKEIGVLNPGIFFLVFACGIGIARLFAGKSFDRRGPRLAGIAAFVTMSIGFIVIALMKTLPGFFLAAFVLGVSQGMLTPTFQAMVNELVPRERRGAANSTYFTAFDLGIAAGSVSVGVVSDKIGLAGAFLVCSVLCGVGLIFFVSRTLPHFIRSRYQPSEECPSAHASTRAP
jgi:MFS family permease